MENKIEFLNTAIKSIKIKNGQFKGLIIKPYLSAEDISVANINCLKQFMLEIKDKDISRYDLFPNVKIAFDLVVLIKCTNIKIEETFKVYDNLVISGLVDFVTSKIKNYESAWNLILKSIELKNTYVGLHSIIEAIEPQALESNVKQISTLLDEMYKKNPEALRKIVETASIQNQMQEIKTEVKSEIKKEKKAVKK